MFDRQAGTLDLVSINSDGTASGEDGSYRPSIDDSGNRIAFLSEATDIATNDLNGDDLDIFVYDVNTKSNTLASVNLSGTGTGADSSTHPFISPSGTSVVFLTRSNDMVIAERVASTEVVAFDLTTRLTVESNSVVVDEGAVVSNSGTFFDGDPSELATISASIGIITQDTGSNGTWTWSLTADDGPDQTQTVTISSTNLAGDVSETTFELTVNNLDPTAVDDLADVDEGDGATVISVVANDTDAAGTFDPLTVTGLDTGATIGLGCRQFGSRHLRPERSVRNFGCKRYRDRYLRLHNRRRGFGDGDGCCHRDHQRRKRSARCR